jgi:hypothetical protein
MAAPDDWKAFVAPAPAGCGGSLFVIDGRQVFRNTAAELAP